MRDILESVFPIEQCEKDVLGGYPDRSGGQALDYFKSLIEDDREIVHWYAGQNLAPEDVKYYAGELAKNYAVVDPDRKSYSGIEAAHKEIERTRRYLQLFVNCGDYFPKLQKYRDPVRDEKNKLLGYMESVAWAGAL